MPPAPNGINFNKFIPSLPIYMAAILVVTPQSSNAAPNDGRRALQDVYLDEQRNHKTFYQSAPVTHVVPTFNTITYALNAESIDATIVPSDDDAARSLYTESLHLKGYRVAPHLSISLKNIGLGFSGEAGHKQVDYSLSPARQNVALYQSQTSKMDYRGFGLYVYWIMPQPFGKRVKPTLTLGNSALAVQHSVGLVKTGSSQVTIEESEFEKYSYNITRNEIGLNIGIRLLKKFSLIPWANYELVNSSDASSKADEADASYQSEYASIMRDDVDLFWHANSRLQYGLDFSVRLFNSLEIHLGGLLGLVTTMGPKNEQITNKSYVLSIAIDQKGN